MKQLVDHCREKDTVEHQLKYFESTYHQKSPIWWYTCEIFLYGMLNHALRCLEMKTMAKLGFVIRKLHQLLLQLYREHLNDFKTKLVVYRVQDFNEKGFHHLNINKDGLLSFNNFLSTSKNSFINSNHYSSKLIICQKILRQSVSRQAIQQIDMTGQVRSYIFLSGLQIDVRHSDDSFNKHRAFKISLKMKKQVIVVVRYCKCLSGSISNLAGFYFISFSCVSYAFTFYFTGKGAGD